MTFSAWGTSPPCVFLDRFSDVGKRMSENRRDKKRRGCGEPSTTGGWGEKDGSSERRGPEKDRVWGPVGVDMVLGQEVSKRRGSAEEKSLVTPT